MKFQFTIQLTALMMFSCGTPGPSVRVITISNLTNFTNESRSDNEPVNLPTGVIEITQFIDQKQVSYPVKIEPQSATASGLAPGEFLLRVDSTWYQLDSDSVDLGISQWGRAGVEQIVSPTQIKATISGLNTDSTENDNFLFFSSASPLEFWANFSFPRPTVATYGFLSTPMNVSLPVFDNTKGDVVRLLRRSSLDFSSAPDFTGTRLTASGSSSDTKLKSGTTDLTFLMTEGTSTSTLDFARSQFADVAKQIHSKMERPFQESLNVSADWRLAGVAVDLVSVFAAGSQTFSDFKQTVQIHNPFPPSMPLKVWTDVLFRFPFAIAGQKPVTAWIGAVTNLNEKMVPLVFPPQNLMVNDQASDEVQSVESAGPLAVSWKAGNGAVPTCYRVTLVRVDQNSGQAKSRPVATVLTTHSSAQFPVSIIERGQNYWVKVEAQLRDQPLGSTPNKSPLTAYAQAVTNVFSISP